MKTTLALCLLGLATLALASFAIPAPPKPAPPPEPPKASVPAPAPAPVAQKPSAPLLPREDLHFEGGSYSQKGRVLSPEQKRKLVELNLLAPEDEPLEVIEYDSFSRAPRPSKRVVKKSIN